MILYVGDWFTVLAMFILAGEASDDSPLAIAGVLAVRSFTFAPLEPITGMLADRFPRKTLMVIANIFSFVMLTSFILLGLLDSLLSVYVLAMLLVLGRATYDPAQTAYMPRVCNEDELLTAWSRARELRTAAGDATPKERLCALVDTLWSTPCVFFAKSSTAVQSKLLRSTRRVTSSQPAA